jgi:hypothetical protein
MHLVHSLCLELWQIIDDDTPEDDETFFADLSRASPSTYTVLDERAVAKVVIVDDDQPGACHGSEHVAPGWAVAAQL